MREKVCPVCRKGVLRRGVKKTRFKYKGESVLIHQPGAFCTRCKDGVLEPADLRTTEKEIRDFHAQVDGYLTTDEIRHIRQKLGLTQKQAARIFGGGANAFSRYERGEVRPPRALDQLLKLLEKRPELLDELEVEAA